MQAAQLQRDLLHNGCLGYAGGHAQVGGGGVQHHLLVLAQSLQGAVARVDVLQTGVDSFTQWLQHALAQGRLNDHLWVRDGKQTQSDQKESQLWLSQTVRQTGTWIHPKPT